MYKIFKYRYWSVVLILFPICLFAQIDKYKSTELEELIIQANNVKKDLQEIIENSENLFLRKNQQLDFDYTLSGNDEILENISAVISFKNLGSIFDHNIKWSQKIKDYQGYRNLNGAMPFSILSNCSVMYESDFNRGIKSFIENGIVQKRDNIYKAYLSDDTHIYIIITVDEDNKLISEIEGFGMPLFERINDSFSLKNSYFKTTFSSKEKYVIENIEMNSSYILKDVLFDTTLTAKRNEFARKKFSKKKSMLRFVIHYNNKQSQFLYGVTK